MARTSWAGSQRYRIRSITNNGSGAARVTSYWPHNLADGAAVRLRGSGGYDGSYTILFVDAVSFDLVGSVFGSASAGGYWAP